MKAPKLTSSGMVAVLAATLLVVGVVYCQMHYAVDAMAGAALAAIVVAGGFLIERGSRTPGF